MTLEELKSLKKGDYVICRVAEHGNETVGKVYKFLRWESNSSLQLQIEKDDNGHWNGYDYACFDVFPFKQDFENILK